MLHWGIIGLGNIAQRFARSLSYFDEAMFYAGASHNPTKRDQFNELFHPQVMYADYDDLLNDDNVDVVYISLPHGMHYKWCKKALEHHKCVLVEKPACLHQDELKELIELSQKNHLFFMEAMKTRFIPLIKILHQEIDKELIGDIISIENHFNSQVPYQPDSYLFDKIQGGALYDVGIYGIASVLDFIQSEVVDIKRTCEMNYDVDTYNKIELVFSDQKKAIIECAINKPRNRMMIIKGTRGQITIDPFYRPEQAIIETNDGESLTCEVKLLYDDFYPEIEAVHQGIAYIEIEDTRMSHQDSLKSIQLMEKIKGLKND